MRADHVDQLNTFSQARRPRLIVRCYSTPFRGTSKFSILLPYCTTNAGKAQELRARVESRQGGAEGTDSIANETSA